MTQITGTLPHSDLPPLTPPPDLERDEARSSAWWGRGMVFQVLLAVAVVLLVLLAAYLLNGVTLRSIEEAQRLTVEARAQTQAAEDLLIALTDAETGQRGYLLTMQRDYLAPYASGEARVQTALANLEKLAATTPWMQQDLASLHQSVTRKMAELAETVSLAQQQGQPAALQIVRTDAGKADMDAARAVLARILARSYAERDHAADLLRAREQEAIRALALAAVAGALLLGAALIVLLVNRARSQRARAAERVQAARLAGTVEHMRDGVAVFDAAGRLLLANGHLSANTGWDAALLRPGAAMADIVAAASGWPNAPLQRLHPGAPARGVETQVDGRVLDVLHSPMPDGGQMLSVADITRRTEAETVARQAQKMEVMGQLTGGVAHDFNNLLQVISANLELLGGRVASDEWLQARLAAAQSGVERAARLTRHLLAFARRQPLAPQSVDTRSLLNGLEDMLRRTLGERVAIEMVLGGGLWPLRADPQQLESALLNLAINARDAMPDGGKLTVEATNASLDDEYAARNAEVTPGQYVVIAVSDTGFGMTQEELVRAIEPFYTTKPEGQGTGLGLPMVYGFARQSGGHFKLYSEKGHGTTARLYVPRGHGDARVLAEPPLPMQTEGALVLLVEDDAAVRAASMQAVRGFGYRVIEASDAKSALALIEGGARPDLLFTDVVMPGKPSAREMVERAKALLPDLAVVFTSGYTENAVVHNGQLDPGVILVSKPWRAAELGRKLQQALREAQRPATKERTLRILLVEDELLVRMTTADLLADLGHEVVQAGSAAEALAALDRGVDLLMTDLGLPDMDGLALAAQARARLPGLRVIVASGGEAGAESGYTVLDKPYDEAGLRAALEQAMGATPDRGSMPG